MTPPSSGRTRWYLERPFLAADRNVTASLHRRRLRSTCVCQAKRVKRQETQFYSGRPKHELPQMSSFSGPARKVFNEGFTSVSQSKKSVVSAFSQEMFFRQSVILFHTLSPFSYMFYFQERLSTSSAERCYFRPVYSWDLQEKCLFRAFSPFLLGENTFHVVHSCHGILVVERFAARKWRFCCPKTLKTHFSALFLKAQCGACPRAFLRLPARKVCRKACFSCFPEEACFSVYLLKRTLF